MIVEFLIFVLTTILAYYFYTYKKIHQHFKDRDVKFLPGVPIFGNVFGSTFMSKHFWEDIHTVYMAFPDEKYVGYVEATTPILMIRDPEIIKNITVKDFDHFVDHRPFFPEEVDPLFGGSLIMMKGDKWRDMRTTLSPAFTASKMRLMVPFMAEVSKNVIEHLRKHEKEDVDIGEIIRRYTNDVIASAAFGLQVNSFKDNNNEFYKMGQTLFNFTVTQRLKLFFFDQFPKLSKKIKINLWGPKTLNFFRNLVSDTMEYREKNNVERPDMIQLLMEASKGILQANSNTDEKDNVGFATVDEALKSSGKSRQWTLDQLASQVFLFFAAGFESSAGALVMSVHEMALNPDVQEKLYQEIKEFKIKNGDLTYDNISQLKYLDCVINETLRKWSPGLIMDRICAKAYELPPPREGAKPYKVQPGQIVYNVINSIHMDPKHYPQPEVFDPDRFSDENKHNIKPFTFMSFGMGPRNCIGSRFALLELKVLVYNLILNYKILKCAKTMDPIKLKPADFNIKAKEGSWVRLEARV